MFKTQYDSHERFHVNSGDPEKVLYSPVFDKNGVMELVESGRENLYDYIQSFKDSVDIHLILKRYEEGDVSVLSRVQGSYGDFTTMPATYAEALNAMISAENYFNGLPVEVRAKFGHSFQQFLASMDKEDFATKMGFRAEGEPADKPVGEAAPAAGAQEGE
uniref:Internal scaffolding protein n=1 Tax=Dulem virus 121 TaxID=3145598 RepID=A0AAU8AW17_9VIRU